MSNAFEKRLRKPFFGEIDGEPLLGMEEFVRALPARERPTDWVLSPNAHPPGDKNASRATSHGDFDNDAATLRATLARILGQRAVMGTFEHHRSEAANRAQRATLTAGA